LRRRLLLLRRLSRRGSGWCSDAPLRTDRPAAAEAARISIGRNEHYAERYEAKAK